jgi:hypothetical protein
MQLEFMQLNHFEVRALYREYDELANLFAIAHEFKEIALRCAILARFFEPPLLIIYARHP